MAYVAAIISALTAGSTECDYHQVPARHKFPDLNGNRRHSTKIDAPSVNAMSVNIARWS